MYKPKTSFGKYALDELSILINDPTCDTEIKQLVPEMTRLVDKFAHLGLSGGSAPCVISNICEILKKILAYNPLTSITGEENEWFLPVEDPLLYQNKRLGSIFKTEHEPPYFLDAIIFQEGDYTFCSNHGVYWLEEDRYVTSRQTIREFPFVPRTFYIDVIEMEFSPGKKEWVIADDKQLDEVFCYYVEKDRI